MLLVYIHCFPLLWILGHMMSMLGKLVPVHPTCDRNEQFDWFLVYHYEDLMQVPRLSFVMFIKYDEKKKSNSIPTANNVYITNTKAPSLPWSVNKCFLLNFSLFECITYQPNNPNRVAAPIKYPWFLVLTYPPIFLIIIALPDSATNASIIDNGW